jgi:biopolymer transport protein TolR
MAISIHTGRKTPMAEINVTPLVDVMLVLLIIFMVTAPMMQEGLSVEVPEAPGVPLEKERNVEEIVISVAENGTIFVNETAVPEAGLVTQIAQMTKDNPSREVYLRGDKKATYGLFVRILSTLKTGGIDKVNIVTNPQEESAPGK